MRKFIQYINGNRKSWNKKAKNHFNSEFYDLDSFQKGRNSLKEIELDLLGNIKNKNILHLMCHFGQDTLSLARLGANVTGVDFSDEAIKLAKNLNADLNLKADFICSDIYNFNYKPEFNFDIIFTSYGVLGWLPDIKKWAEIIQQNLKPGGKFILVEFHPFIWSLDDDFKNIFYSYFYEEKPIISEHEGSYADTKSEAIYKDYGWNHSLSEIINSLLNQNLKLTHFKEYDYSVYNCFPDMIETHPGKWVFENFGSKIPYLYSLIMEKEND